MNNELSFNDTAVAAHLFSRTKTSVVEVKFFDVYTYCKLALKCVGKHQFNKTRSFETKYSKIW